MFIYKLKGLALFIAINLLRPVPPRFLNKFRRKLYLRQLSRKDGPAAAVEYAKDSGVKAGKNCRFYGATFGVEPFLIEIGDNVLISDRVQFLTHDGAVHIFREEIKGIVSNFGKIQIGNNCFIGYGAIILPNVQIGDNCIICAGAVVADSFPDDSVIMGNPAKKIFSTHIYRQMKLCNPLTLRNEECFFPDFDFLPYETRKKFILGRIDNISIRRPRIN